MEILVKERLVLGKKVRALRREGLIPAEIYGEGVPNRHVQIQEKDFRKVFKSAGEHTLIEAITEKGEKVPVLIKDVYRNAISGEVLSVDFHIMRLDQKTKAKIPVELIGIAPAIKNGFVVVRVFEEIEVEAFPHKLPRKIEIDVTSLENAGQNIHISEINLGADVKILNSPEVVIVTVKEKAKEEVIAPAPVAEGTPTETATKTEEAPAQNPAS